ncbi:MAG: SDR family oxidoreductase [Nitrospirae bacterium]|nr:SDR family oxidoreductase [Nitrospirota bacterium]
MILKGKVAIVTGGGTGIGRAIARALAAEGAQVALSGRRAHPLEAAARELAGLAGQVSAIPGDVRVRRDVENLVDRAVKQWGHLDILVNNAGRSGRTPIDQENEALWRDIIETNLLGMYLMTRATLRWMREGGRVINLSSVLGKFGVPGYTAYCASKHGVIGFTRSLALEVAERGITVNAVCPGWVETDMAEQGMRETAAVMGITQEEFKQQALEAVPIKRYVEAEEVAALVLYLASPAAAAMTGQAMNICGGSTTA